MVRLFREVRCDDGSPSARSLHAFIAVRCMRVIGVVVALCGLGGEAVLAQGKRNAGQSEHYVREPLPPGIKVFLSKVDGPIYTDANGRTLYHWPRKQLPNGATGDGRDAPSSCDNKKSTTNSGLMSPYPAGLTLPDAQTRVSCEQIWPPALAADGAEPVGKWTIVPRKDGRNQWAYDGFVLYTSSMDRKPGDTIGGNRLYPGRDAAVVRFPIGPRPDLPAQFTIEQSLLGRQIVLSTGYSVYTWDGDHPNKSNCTGSCLDTWRPVLASQIGAASRVDWSVIERSPGVNQWAYRGKPLYTYVRERGPGAHHGVDVPGWTIVFTQLAPPPPPEFTRQISAAGIVLADSNGKTIYIYNCGDDALDQFLCDHPDTPQQYRYAICGGGQEHCLKTFPYVIAHRGSKGANEAWSVMAIDPATGKRARPGQDDALRVWAYRDRPVFTFARDDRPGSIRAQSWGEFFGQRNGYKAFFLREEFQER